MTYTKRIHEVLKNHRKTFDPRGIIVKSKYITGGIFITYKDGSFVYIKAYTDSDGPDLFAHHDPEPLELLYGEMITKEEWLEYIEKIKQDREKNERKEWERLNQKYGGGTLTSPAEPQ